MEEIDLIFPLRHDRLRSPRHCRIRNRGMQEKSSQCLNKVSRYIVIAVPERKAELPARALEDNTSGDGLGNTAFGQRKDTRFPTSL
jgi:hypothetical protein